MKQEIIRVDLGGVNCYLGKQDENFILFDTGGSLTLDKVNDNRREKLLKALTDYGCTPNNLKLIVLTHGDVDHTSNADYLRKKYNVKIAMHAGDVHLVEDPSVENVMSNFNFRSFPLSIISKIMNKNIRKMNKRIVDKLKPFNPDILLNDGDPLNEFGFDASILHVPGHTSGSIAIFTSTKDIISGDIFANIKKPSLAPNALNFKELLISINKMKALNIQTVYPGHGTPFHMSEY